jgi:hypothetical protein
MAKLQKTSIQLSPVVLQSMDHWPGLTRSEAIRLSIERGHYLSCINSAEIAFIAQEYDPILREALEDLDYDDYRLAARSLPEIVAGYFGEVLSEKSDGRTWQSEFGGQFDHNLDPTTLVKKLEELNPWERIGILDCVVAERHRRAERSREGEAKS